MGLDVAFAEMIHVTKTQHYEAEITQKDKVTIHDGFQTGSQEMSRWQVHREIYDI